MSIKHSIYSLLEPIGIYALNTGGLIDSELSAYTAGFELLESRLEKARQSIYPTTASGGELDIHEVGVGVPVRTGIADNRRRELILRRLGGPYPPTRAGSEEALAACGFVSPRIREHAAGLSVRAGGVEPGLTAGECWLLALQTLPAHIKALPDAQSWDELDGLGFSFDKLDSTQRDWDWRELVGIG